MSDTERGEQARGCECVCGGAGPVFTEFLKRMGPPEGARRHFDAARVEFLKGLRALIDARIDSLSHDGAAKGAKVTVE